LSGNIPNPAIARWAADEMTIQRAMPLRNP
jgi:hypothetical protein